MGTQLLEKQLLKSLHAWRSPEERAAQLQWCGHLRGAIPLHARRKERRVAAALAVQGMLMVVVTENHIFVVLLEGRNTVFTVPALLWSLLVEACVCTDDLT